MFEKRASSASSMPSTDFQWAEMAEDSQSSSFGTSTGSVCLIDLWKISSKTQNLLKSNFSWTNFSKKVFNNDRIFVCITEHSNWFRANTKMVMSSVCWKCPTPEIVLYDGPEVIKRRGQLLVFSMNSFFTKIGKKPGKSVPIN